MSAIQQAITSLEQERAPLAEQLARLDAAIVALRNIHQGNGSAFAPEMVGRPVAVAAPVRRPVTTRSAPSPEAAVRAALLNALSGGPLSTGDLAKKAKLTNKRSVLNMMLRLTGDGLAHTTGTRRSQRWHLGAKGSKSPKEAESRGR